MDAIKELLDDMEADMNQMGLSNFMGSYFQKYSMAPTLEEAMAEGFDEKSIRKYFEEHGLDLPDSEKPEL